MLLGDDIHNISALINGKIVILLVRNLQIISAYLLPHPYPKPNSYPAIVFSWQLSLSPTVCLSYFVIDT